MLCQYSRTAQPHTLIATLTSLPLLFASSAWAAPLPSLSKRGSESGASKILVYPQSILSSFFARSQSPFLPRRPSLWLLFSSSQSRCCSTGSRFFLGSGTFLFTLCWHRTNGLPPFKFGTSQRRRSPGQPRRLRLRLRQLLAQSDGQGVIGALPVKSRRAHCQHT